MNTDGHRPQLLPYHAPACQLPPPAGPAASKRTCQKASSSPHCPTPFFKISTRLIVSPSALSPTPDTGRPAPRPASSPRTALLPATPIPLPSLGVSEHLSIPPLVPRATHLHFLSASRMLALECSSDGAASLLKPFGGSWLPLAKAHFPSRTYHFPKTGTCLWAQLYPPLPAPNLLQTPIQPGPTSRMT